VEDARPLGSARWGWVVRYQVVVEGRTFEVEVTPDGRVWVDRRPLDVDLAGVDGLPLYSLLVDNRSYEAHVAESESGVCEVVLAGRPYRASLQAEEQPCGETGEGSDEAGDGEVAAPLPGLLVEVRVVEGQTVQRGDIVAVLESMKMHLELHASRSGVVQSVHGAGGQDVAQGELVAFIGEP
jgi:biotin carboxyl carrier protein